MRNIQLPPPSASDLMLDILSGYGPQGLSVQALCKAGRVMDIAETNVRVALNRLTNQSKIFSPQRGFYAIDNEGYALHEDVENWWTRENLINDWAGHWVGAVAPHEKKRQLQAGANICVHSTFAASGSSCPTITFGRIIWKAA